MNTYPNNTEIEAQFKPGMAYFLGKKKNWDAMLDVAERIVKLYVDVKVTKQLHEI